MSIYATLSASLLFFVASPLSQTTTNCAQVNIGLNPLTYLLDSSTQVFEVSNDDGSSSEDSAYRGSGRRDSAECV